MSKAQRASVGFTADNKRVTRAKLSRSGMVMFRGRDWDVERENIIRADIGHVFDRRMLVDFGGYDVMADNVTVGAVVKTEAIHGRSVTGYWVGDVRYASAKDATNAIIDRYNATVAVTA